jgi:hypothetical protein
MLQEQAINSESAGSVASRMANEFLTFRLGVGRIRDRDTQGTKDLWL